MRVNQSGEFFQLGLLTHIQIVPQHDCHAQRI
jgi:hypothetical protein